MLNNWIYTRGADKFLAKPGRIKATVTKLILFNTLPHKAQYIPQSIALTFVQPLKNSEVYPYNQLSAAAMTSMSVEKCQFRICFFSPGCR
jgi:hypothetical protein